MNDAPTPTPNPTPRRRRIRIGRWTVISLLGLYVVGCSGLYFGQDAIVFPGHRTQGSPDAVTHEGFVERIELKSADGTPIVASYRATQVNPTTAPTVLFFYGNAMCAAWCDSIITMLNDRGCNVLVPDYQGYGESGGEPSEAGCYATADAAWAYLRNQRGVPADRVVVMGWSLGSAVALDLASRVQPAGLITLSAFTSVPDVAHQNYPLIPTSLLLQSKFDNRSKVPNVTCPVLLFHGRQDTLIEPSNADTLIAAFGSQAELVWLDRADHNTMFEAEPAALRSALRRFLTKTTGTLEPIW